MKIIQNATIVTEDQVVERGRIVIDKGIITAVEEADVPLQRPCREIIDASGKLIFPGFIDLHLHGGGGRDVMDGTLEAVDVISRTHAKYGTTAFLATTLTAPVDQIMGALQAVREAVEKGTGGARVLGVHMEGPFINDKLKGAHQDRWILKPDINLLRRFLEKADNTIRIITMAPEIPGALELAQYAAGKGIILSIGHSDATYRQVQAACEAGFSHAAHLFNGMRGFHHREPGVAGALLLEENVTVEVIADGIHLHPAVIELVLRIKGLDRTVLVTDSISAAGMGNGRYSLGGLEVKVSGGKARLADGTIAGSTLTMNSAVGCMVKELGLALPQAAKLASANPARVLGLDRHKGTVQPGKDADLVALNPDFSVYFTMVGGEIVYHREGIY